ncbi:MAG: 3-isopropylmalate dehydratase large subunit [Clostridiales bacterium]|nr:3-isopropylmalate dehydratase large subunit [Clostridiales bacterium]
MTITQKILAFKAGLEYTVPGQLIEIPLDLVMGNDITAPLAVNEFHKAGFEKVSIPDKTVFVMDHFVPNKDIKSAENAAQIRRFSAEQKIDNFFDVGTAGIEHALLPEKGLVTAGDAVIGADSHTCTYGALGAFSTGVGSTDLAFSMATGKLWFKVPSAIKVILTGRLSKYVCGKDVILHLIGILGVEGATYKSLEFSGDGVSSLSMDDRFTIANMAVECGAKNGIFPVDNKTLEYISEHAPGKDCKVFEADCNAEYDSEITIDLSALKPTVAFPHLPSNTRTFDEIDDDIQINQVIIGSCTNGRLEDMKAAAEILRGKKVNKNTRTIIIPATQEVFLESVKQGLTEIFINAGAVFSLPTCGPCLGGHMGVLAAGERAVSTTNRNFIGRMGHRESEVYLASPAVAAASAIAGRLCSPEDLR